MEEYRDTHGHFVAKEDNGERCQHGEGAKANGGAGDASRIKQEAEANAKKAAEIIGAHHEGWFDREELKQAGLTTTRGDPYVRVFYKKGPDKESPSLRGYWSPYGNRVFYRIWESQDVRPGFSYADSDAYDLEEALEEYGKAMGRYDDFKGGKGEGARLRSVRESLGDDPDKWISASDDDLAELLDDSPITEGARVGGYIGKSRSESAAYSEELGSKPMSKWTKEDLIDAIVGGDDEMPRFEGKLRGLPFAALKRVALHEDGWHHVGAFMTPTTFYAVNIPRDIVLNLKKEMNGQAKAARKAAKESKQKKVFGV